MNGIDVYVVMGMIILMALMWCLWLPLMVYSMAKEGKELDNDN